MEAPHPLTPISTFEGWTAKREDGAAFTSPDYPSGSKVRQYAAMAAKFPKAPMIVGCSAHSAMQIYVAAAAQITGVRGIVYTAARKVRTAATEYAIGLGADVVEVRPAYLSVVRARAKERAQGLGTVVRWNVGMALQDAFDQCKNIPLKTKRVLVPTGSGLTAAGVLAGMAWRDPSITVVAIAVSTMDDKADIIAKAKGLTSAKLPRLSLIRAPGAYEDWKAAKLSDGTVLDPYYAAKAYRYIKRGDCLWIPGLRPLSSMPEGCQKALESW